MKHCLLWVAATSSFALVACGGGGSGVESLATVGLHVALTEQGTYVRCESTRPTSVTLRRTSASGITSQSMRCPTALVLSGDLEPSAWEALTYDGSAEVVIAQTETHLPKAVVLWSGTEYVPIPLSTPLRSALPGLALQALTADLRPLTASELAAMRAADNNQVLWQWVTTIAGKSYLSAPAHHLELAERDLGFGGALAMGDSVGDERSELLGTVATSDGLEVVGYAELGLSPLFTERVFRDVRFADLLNRGMQDIISNVYGGGCTQIGLRRETGGYDFVTPTRSDGSCIGGHGETILVADFDNDGWVDIVLPSYERFDLLKNEGNGRFTEVAEVAGILSPNYRPPVEGAAAVDIDLNGTVDIVIANEVFINDGTGHFTPLSNPFGPTRIADEGLTVADMDDDGIYDLVKHHPSLGPRIFWGRRDRISFDDSSWLLGGASVLTNSFGVGAGRFTGNRYLDIVFAGGSIPPRLCIQPQPRQFQCLPSLLPTYPGAWSDLLMITDLDGNGSEELVSRYGSIRIFSGSQTPEHVFRIDLRDGAGLRNQFGRSIKASCSIDGSSLGLRFVDGGNGFMAQTSYVVPFVSPWCPSIFIEVESRTGGLRFGPLLPGTSVLKVNG